MTDAPHGDTGRGEVVTGSPPRGGSGNTEQMARGGSLNLLGAVIQQACLLLLVTAIAHLLGKEELGRYVECFALYSLVGLFALAGFRAGLTRFIAIHLADADLGRLRGTLRLGMGVTAVASLALAGGLFLLAPEVARIMRDPAVEDGVRLVALAIPAYSISEAAQAATQGWRSQKVYTLIGRIFDPAMRLLLTVGALLLGASYLGALAALVVACWMTALLSLGALWRRLRRVDRAPAVYRIGDLMRFSTVSWMSTLAATGLIWADTLILGAQTSAGQVGVYNIATRLVTLAVFVLQPITATFAPTMAHLHHVADEHEAARAYGSATRWTVLLSMPAFVLLLTFPSELLHFFGGGFVVGASVTVILAVGQLVGAIAGPCGVVLNMSGRVILSLADNVGVLVLNIVLNIVLIPRIGIVGAAIAWSTSIVLANIVKVIQVRRVVGIKAEGAASVVLIGIAVPVAAAGVLVNHLIAGWLPSLIVGAVTIFVIYVILAYRFGLDVDDHRLLQRLRRRMS